MSVSGLDDRLARERRSRLQAERLLALRSEELYSANRKLAEHASALSHQVIEQREENAALVGQSTQARAALEVATEKADIAERRLWDSLTAFEDGFAIYDQDWRMVMANPAYLATFDGVADVAPGASFEAILRIAIDEGIVDLNGERSDAWLERMIARWEQPEIAPIELRLWNGVYVRLQDTRTPEGDIVSLALNITETIKREKDLREARDAAEAAAQAKAAFLANMSHEIRTPMNGVVSMADLLRETDLDEDQQLYADTIRNSGEALLVIINDVLDFSKIEAGKLELHVEPFDLERMIHEILRLLRPALQGKDLTLELDYDIFLPHRIIGDPGRLRQILTNLIGNAIKFTASGSIKVMVVGEDTSYPPDDIPLRIVVEDTGIGIPEDKQAHVFGEFNQVESESNRRFDGTGLGLAISQRLVRLMDGQMWLTSKPGVGSAFGFAVTLKRDPTVAAAPVAALPPDRNRVHVMAPSETVPDPLNTYLMRLKADVTVSLSLPSDVPHAVVHFAGADLEASMVTLEAAGFAGPVLVVCKQDGMDLPSHEALQLIAIGPGVSAAEFRAALVRDSRQLTPALPEEAQAAPRRLRVFAAEDNKTNQLVFKTMLKRLDLDLDLFENGALALAACMSDRPDLLFTDISMPEMDGLDLTASIRAHEAEAGLPPLPIIAMTAHAMAEDRDRILAAGLDGYLTKPLKKDELFAALRENYPDGVNPFPQV